ncbi:MAG TPA: DedA family protein [Marmoricola sp.]|nr:DedA family protein [Marmoricola sp.]
MTGFLDPILHLSPVWAYVVVGLLVFAEDAIFVGFAVPGETAAVLGGVATVLGRASLPVMIVVVVVAAIVGDSVGYEVGRHFFGPKVLGMKLLRKRRAGIDRAMAFLRRRGGLAVFLGRFTAFFRAMMPALAGASRMRYRTFLVWNAAGGILWGTGYVVLGHIAGASYHALEATVGRDAAIAVGAVVVVAIIVWRVRAHRRERV